MSKSESLRAYLLKNYGSKEKRKKKKKKKVPTHSRNNESTIPSHNTNNKTNIDNHNNVNDTNDDYVMRMPDLNDGSGWKPGPNILAPSSGSAANNTTNRKRKHTDNAPPINKRPKRQRYDTDSDDDSDDIQINRKPTQNKIRYDTSDENDSDIEVTRKPMNNNGSDSDSDINVERKPSKMIKDETKNMTVYRDKNGKRISENEYNKLKRKHSKKDDDDDMEWASGLVQKYKAFEKEVILQRQKYKSIARYQDDAEMNIDLQNEHRNEDPLNQMKGYHDGDNVKRNKKETDNINVLNERPMYKGKPWPNRYGILPGYRWDGVDRGNGFEGTKLLHDSQRKDYKKKRYRAANSDM